LKYIFIYSFTAPKVKPLTTYLPKNKKINIGGNIVTTEVAAILFQATPVVAKKLKVPIGSGFVEYPLNTNGKTALFQLKVKVNIEETIIPGKHTGITTLKSAPNLVAPSTIAASSISTGTSSKKLFIINMEKGIANV